MLWAKVLGDTSFMVAPQSHCETVEKKVVHNECHHYLLAIFFSDTDNFYLKISRVYSATGDKRMYSLIEN